MGTVRHVDHARTGLLRLDHQRAIDVHDWGHVVIPHSLQGLSDTAALVAALSEAEKVLPGSIHQIAAWVAGGEPPDQLPALPETLKSELALAAAQARAKAGSST